MLEYDSNVMPEGWGGSEDSPIHLQPKRDNGQGYTRSSGRGRTSSGSIGRGPALRETLTSVRVEPNALGSFSNKCGHVFRPFDGYWATTSFLPLSFA